MMEITQHLNWVDYTIIVIVGISAIISFSRGFVREAISLVVWIAGILVAMKFADVLEPHLGTWISSPGIRYGLAFLAIFLAVFIIGILINVIIHAAVDKSGLTVTDRFLGIFFGAARGVLIVAVLLIFFGATSSNPANNVAVNESPLASKIMPITLWLNHFLPKQIKSFSQWIDLNNNDTIDIGNQ